VVVSGRDGGYLDLELFRKRQQHRRRYGPLVVLDLVEIAGGNAEPLRERRLGRTIGFPEFAYFSTDIKLAVGHSQFRILLNTSMNIMHLHLFIATIFRRCFYSAG